MTPEDDNRENEGRGALKGRAIFFKVIKVLVILVVVTIIVAVLFLGTCSLIVRGFQ